MLDIATFKNRNIHINIRFKEQKLEHSNELAKEYLIEFNKIYDEIRNLLT